MPPTAKPNLFLLNIILLAILGFTGCTQGGNSGDDNTAVTDNTTSSTLSSPDKKEIAMQLVSSAENSTLDWRAQYSYIEDIKDGRGYTAGIIGFCSGTGDMLEVIQYYSQLSPNNGLEKYIPALNKVKGSDSHLGLDPDFTKDWKIAAQDPKFQQAQDYERDKVYFNPALQQGKTDGLRALGQFIYFDAIVMHGSSGFEEIRTKALSKSNPPALGGNERDYLLAFLEARKAAMLAEAAHDNTDRVDNEQRIFLDAGNFDLTPPLEWKIYGDSYRIAK